MATRSYREIAETDWTTETDGSPRELIAAASAHAAFKELKQVRALLEEIRDLLRGLGSDGLHEVIRFHRREVKKANAARRKPRTTRTEYDDV